MAREAPVAIKPQANVSVTVPEGASVPTRKVRTAETPSISPERICKKPVNLPPLNPKIVARSWNTAEMTSNTKTAI